ncbi:hypothetical protein T439DRAFT_303994 [Meredithblackwellia eburnea MCA 4105]
MKSRSRYRRRPLPLLSLLSLLLPLLNSTTAAATNTTTLPKIDFSSLGTVAVVGSFSALQLYDPTQSQSQSQTNYSSTRSSLISRGPDGTLTPLGSTNVGGQILAICQNPKNGFVYVGGAFTSLAGHDAQNIVRYDPSAGTYNEMGTGLDGLVRTISCGNNNSTTVYVGGDFERPVGGDGTGFAGHLAAWTEAGGWTPWTIDGVDGTVRTIDSSSDGKSLFLGGDFTTTFLNGTNSTFFNMSNIPPGVNQTTLQNISDIITPTTTSFGDSGNGTVFASLGSSLVPISLNSSDYWASPTSYLNGFGRPQYVFCPQGLDGPGTSWLLVDGMPGFFTARFYRPLKVRGIRLGNTFWGGRGTRDFYVTSIPDNTIIELRYASDPTNPASPIWSCTDHCLLAHAPSVPYQDFLFPSDWTFTGFQLNIFGWYGDGAGLHLLQLLSEGSYDYSVEANNISPCQEGLAGSTPPGLTTTGDWVERTVNTDIAGTVQRVVCGQITGGSTAVQQSPTMTWTPFVVMSGGYRIEFLTPGCVAANDCPGRTLAKVVVTPTTGPSVTTVIDQTNTVDVTTTIFQGNLAATAQGGGVVVVVSLADGGAPNEGQQYYLVADQISLVAASSNGTVFYNGQGTNQTITVNTTTTTGGSSSLNSSSILDTGRAVLEYAPALGGGTGTFGDVVPSSQELSATGTLQNATGFDQLSFYFAQGAVVNSIVSTSTGGGGTGRVFVGGAFVYTNPNTGVSSTNVVEYYPTRVGGNGVVAAPGTGLNGPVTSLVELGGYLYAAGTFTATQDGRTSGLAGAARWAYDTPGSTWTSLGSSGSIAGKIAQLGIVTTSSSSNGAAPGNSSSSIVAVGAGGSGLAFYDPGQGLWNATEAGFFLGNLTAFGGGGTNASALAFIAGPVVAASGGAAPGGAILSATGGVPSLSSFGFTFNSSTSSSSGSSSSGSNSTNTTAKMAKRSARAIRDAVGALFLPRATSPVLQERATTTSVPVNNVVTSLPSSLTSTTTGQILAGAFWKNGSTSYMVLGGNFVATGGVENVGLYDTGRKTIKPLSGETVTGTVVDVQVFGDVAWIGGNFSTATGRIALATYDLATSTAQDSPPALTGYTGSNPSVNVIAQRPGFSSTIVVAGAFASAGSVQCQSICSWDSKALQWTSLGSGLEGVVGALSFTGSNSEYLLAAGSFLINGTTTYLAQWNYKNETWTVPGSASSLPGPATAVSADGTNQAKIFVAGKSTTDNSAYLQYWNGTTWSSLNSNGLQSASGVQQLVFVPLTATHASNDIIEKDRMLMVSGDLTINSTAMSTALFDGQNWYPYLVSTSSTGGSGAVSQFFYSITSFTLAGRHYMAVGLVILISIAIALGLVFLLVLIGLLIALARRRDEPQYPQPADQRQYRDSIQVQHHPTALLEAVGAATAVMLEGKGNKEKEQERLGAVDHDSIAGPMSFDADSEEDGQLQSDAIARARYSFQGEHVGELSVTAGEDLVVLEASDANWYLVANQQGQRGLMPASYLA